MGRKGRAVLVILVVAIILLAAVFAFQKGLVKLPWEDDATRSAGGPAAYDVTVNGTAANIILRDNMSGASLSSVRIILYGPGLGQGQWALHGGNSSEEVLPNVEMSYVDVDGDSTVSAGDNMIVWSEAGLAFGVWHLNVVQPDEDGERNESMRFQVLPPGVGPFDDDLEIHFLDVGQGDATLIRTSDSRWVLIDAGPSSSAGDLLEQLDAKGVDRIDALVISHPHTDHYGGADEVLKAYDVGRVYHPGLESGMMFDSLLDVVEEEGCPVYTDEHLDPGDYLNISMTEDFRVMSIASSGDTNEASIVMLVANQGMSVLLTGDLGLEGEALFVQRWGGADVDVDVLKVGHHGSRSSSSTAFLELVSPERAVISVGEDNSYGHPHAEALERLAALSIEVSRTEEGAITIAQHEFS